jgi:hypothetical protein
MSTFPLDLSDLPKPWQRLLVDRIGEPRGFVRIRRYNPELGISEPVEPWSENLVVNSGRGVISQQISGYFMTGPVAWTQLTSATPGQGATQNTVTRALIGIGGHDPMTLLPLTPSLTDVNLGSFVASGELTMDAVTFPTSTSVAFQFHIDASSPIPAFSEAGLAVQGAGAPTAWSAADPGANPTHILFSRKCFGYITKVAGWQYQFSWIIVF